MEHIIDIEKRQARIRELLRQSEVGAIIITNNVNLFYTYGSIISGYIYLPAEGEMMVFVKRPNTLKGENIFPIRKPEQIKEILAEKGINLPDKIMLEGDSLSFNEYTRLANALAPSTCVNGTPLLRKVRSIKTPYEIELLRQSAIQHVKAYQQIPSVYVPGMDDRQLSIEVERLMRLEGSLGLFRVFGESMEIFAGSLLAGENAENPSPYDFALGGEGLDASLPGSVNGTPLKEGTTVMVDFGGNFYGYMHDMTRVYSIGKLPQKAYDAHRVCLEIQEKFAEMAKPGVACEDIYNMSIETIHHYGYSDYFMGTQQQAKFVGHGIGLEINEAPVLAPRVKQPLETGMVIAMEPKIVLPDIGAVGIENTWVVTEDGIERLNSFSDEIVEI